MTRRNLVELDRLVGTAADRTARRLRADTALAGIPWGVSLGALVERLGVVRWFDFVDAVRIDDSTVLALPPAPWFHHLMPDLDGAATHFSADFWLDPDVRVNHASVVERIETTLGPATPTGTSNTVSHTWDFGWIEVRCRCFPADLQDPRTVNPLLDRHPELSDRTTVHLKSSVGWLNDAIAERVGAAPDRAMIPSEFAPVTRAATTHLHADSGLEALTAWRDADGFGLSTAHATAVGTHGASPVLHHRVRTPAKGSGSADLVVSPGGRADGLMIARSDDHRALDDLAPRVAGQLGLELEHEAEPDV